MDTNNAGNRILIRVSEDGKHAAAGMSLEPLGTKPGGGGDDQPYDGHGRYLGTAGPGGISGGSVVRGKVTPPQKPKYPPPPPAPRRPHLTYSQKPGELTGPAGETLAVGYAGRGGGQNNPEAEGITGVGPIPEGNWCMENSQSDKWPEPSFRLVPDEQTRKRVVALGRDPDSFYIHAQARLQKDKGRESAGCIALEKQDRIAVGAYKGWWIHVEK